MIAADYFQVSTLVTLGAVAGVLMVSVVASIAYPAPGEK